jgi:hypothetical protein
MAVVPALADLYSNGPINGTSSAFTINSGFAISDSFVLSSASTVTGVDFGAWTFPGDSVTSVQWLIGTTPFANTYSGVAPATDTFFGTADAFYTVDSDSFSTGSISLGAGTYYLTLQSATTVDSDPALWDINYGPSAVYENYEGNVAPDSNSFDILETTGTVTPEPGYWALLSVAIVGLIWVKRRRARVQA